MKTIKKPLNWLTAFAFLGAVTMSCQKQITSTTDDTQETTVTNDVTEMDASAETEFDDVFNITMDVKATDAGDDIGLGDGISGIYAPVTNSGGTILDSPDSARCFTVTVVPNTPGVFPKTVTLDFGAGCLGRDGKLRKGKIITVYTGRMIVPGSKATTTFDNYYVDSFHIEGTHINENTSASNQQSWHVQVVNGKITNTGSGRWKLWNSNKTITQIEGNGTPLFPLDDVFKITGTASGSNAGGNTWTSAITDPLIKKFTCHWIVKGTVVITRNAHVATLDYGSGNCDNQAVITVNGNSRTITLH